MRLRSKTGDALHKRLEVKVFVPSGRVERRSFVAKPRKGFSGDDADKILDGISKNIERIFPGQDFNLVQVGPSKFNFVWREKHCQPSL